MQKMNVINVDKAEIDLNEQQIDYTDSGIKYILYSYAKQNEYIATNTQGRKVEGMLLKIVGVAKTLEQADSIATLIIRNNPQFDVDILPFGMWRPIEFTVDDIQDAVYTDPVANELMQSFFQNSQKKTQDIEKFNMEIKGNENIMINPAYLKSFENDTKSPDVSINSHAPVKLKDEEDGYTLHA